MTARPAIVESVNEVPPITQTAYSFASYNDSFTGAVDMFSVATICAVAALLIAAFESANRFL